MLKQHRNYDAAAASNAAIINAGGERITRQEFKDDADIRVLLKRFGVAGTMPAPRKPPEYGDFSAVEDFETAMLSLADAKEKFMRVPAELRDRFRNDPHEFLEFVQDDDNYNEAHELGLVPARKTESPPAGGAGNTESSPAGDGGEGGTSGASEGNDGA